LRRHRLLEIAVEQFNTDLSFEVKGLRLLSLESREQLSRHQTMSTLFACRGIVRGSRKRETEPVRIRTTLFLRSLEVVANTLFEHLCHRLRICLCILKCCQR